jgi:hypothetical protein
MNKNEIMSRASKIVGKASFQLKKHSPEILVVAGVAGTVVSAIIACKATLKVNEIVEDVKHDIDDVHDAVEKGITKAGENYSVEDSKKDLAVIYAKTGVSFAKLYAPAVILGTLSITSILASNNILRKRNVALSAAYAAVDKGFKDYRERVVERFGEQVDKELKYNIKAKKFDEVTTDPETGKEKKVKTMANVVNPADLSDYAHFFSPSRYLASDHDYNMMFLRAEQNYANDKLTSRGYLFLNEVCERLGLPITKAGQVVGWVKNSEKSDGFVDFNIREIGRDVDGRYESDILLDFNVDGPILDLI